MFEKDLKSSEAKYVSCIKINGSPILPPLITHAKRKEMHRYKQQATKLERRLKRERELRQYIDKYYSSNLESCTNILMTTSLEHRLSFEDDLISQMNDIENELNKTDDLSNVPSRVHKKTPSLSCDLQVSQYADNEFTVLTNFQKCKSDIIAIDESTYSTSLARPNSPENDLDLSECDHGKPRLIRSNSYILESPSPMLLEHLRKRTESIAGTPDESVSVLKLPTDEIEDRNVVANMVPSHLIRSETKDNAFEQDQDNLDYSNYTDTDRTESELRNISTCLSDQISNNDDLTIIGNQYQLKAFIDNNVPQMLNESAKENGNYSSSRSLSDNRLDSSANNSNTISSEGELTVNYNSEGLQQILNNIPEMYSRQIMELLEKQKQEQLIRVKAAELGYSESHHTSFIKEHDKIGDGGCVVHEEFTYASDYDVKLGELEASSKVVEMISEDLSTKSNLSCSRELFPNYDQDESLESRKKEYAASIIGAAAKGYLIRRLMRTDRVQTLIQTIRDALICAMQLHSESSDNINESDVELHRRLIQQVSAACYEFYDVFFALNTSEQMMIIRVDREKQKEKLKRPLSRVSSASKSSRSSRAMSK